MFYISSPTKRSLIFFLVLQVLSITGLCMQPRNYGDITRAIESVRFDDSRELQLHQTLGKNPGQPNRGLGVFHRKSDKAAGYADGIIELVINATKAPAANALVFSNYSQLKNKPNALLILKLKGTFKKLTFTLPMIDTVIEGDDFPESKFIFHGNTNQYKQVYFTDAQKHNVVIKVSGPASSSHFGGNVFAMTPGKFELMQGSIPFVVEQLKMAPAVSPMFVTPLLPTFSYPVFSSNLFSTLSLQQQVLPHVPQIPLLQSAPPITQIVPDIEITQEDHANPKPHRELWPHQKEHIRQISMARNNGFKYSTIFSATGTGKSTTIKYTIETLEPSRVVLLLTSRKNLITQLAQDFASDGHLKVFSSDATNANVKGFIKTAVIHKDTHRQNVIITTLQGFQRLMPDRELLQGIDMIIYDEAHNLLSKKRIDMVNELKSIPDLEMLFFTATPTRLNTKTGATNSVYQLSEEDEKEPHVKPFTIKQAIEAGVNAPFQIVHVTGAELDLKLEQSHSEYKIADTAKQINIPKYHRMVFDIYMNAVRRFEGGAKPLLGEYAMAFASNIDHAETLATYLNEQNIIIPAHKSAYENSIRSFVMGLEAKVAPPELKAIWKAAYPSSKLLYSTQFFSANDLKQLATDFLKAFPYVFADAVHSGNETIKYSDTVIDAKLLRNKHGGSTFICGADKLTEGFDNPKISIGFMLAPVRDSNTVGTQRFGRLARINPNDKAKVAVAIEFLWDKDQLLLSSTDLLGCMCAGPQGASTLEILEHVSDVAEYFLSTTLVTEGTAPRFNKKIKKFGAKPEMTAKRKRAQAPLTQKDVLVDQLEDVLRRLEKFCHDLDQYTLLPNEHEEVMEVVEPEAQSASQYPKRDPAALEITEELYSDKVAQRANDAMKRVKDFFNEEKPSKKPRITLRLDDDGSPNSHAVPTKNNDSNRKLYKKIKRAINQAKSFMSHCQFQNMAQNYSDMLNEIIITANALAKETLDDTPEREPIAIIQPLPIPTPPTRPRSPVIVDLTQETHVPYAAPGMVYAPGDAVQISLVSHAINTANAFLHIDMPELQYVPRDTLQKVAPVKESIKKALENIAYLKDTPLTLANNLLSYDYGYIISFFEDNPNLAARVTAIDIKVPQFDLVQEYIIKLLSTLTQLHTLKLDYSNVSMHLPRKTALVGRISMLAKLRSFTCDNMYPDEIEAVSERIPAQGLESTTFPALEELNLMPVSSAKIYEVGMVMQSKGWRPNGGTLSFTKLNKGKNPSIASPFAHYAVNAPKAQARPQFVVPQQHWEYGSTTQEVSPEAMGLMITKQATNLFNSYLDNIVAQGQLLDPQLDFAKAAGLIKSPNVQNTDQIELELRQIFFNQAAEFLWRNQVEKSLYFNVLTNLLFFANKFPWQKPELIRLLKKVIDRDCTGKFANRAFENDWKTVFDMRDYKYPNL